MTTQNELLDALRMHRIAYCTAAHAPCELPVSVNFSMHKRVDEILEMGHAVDQAIRHRREGIGLAVAADRVRREYPEVVGEIAASSGPCPTRRTIRRRRRAAR